MSTGAVRSYSNNHFAKISGYLLSMIFNNANNRTRPRAVIPGDTNAAWKRSYRPCAIFPDTYGLFLRNMSIEIAFQVIESVAVVIGVGFAIVQVRQYRREKHREAAMELMHAFQTPSFAKAMNLVYNLPDGLSKEEIENLLGKKFHLVYALMTTWESLGILVFRGEIDLDLVDEFFSGPLKISWQKLQGHVMGERELLGRDTIEEWFQWLTERLAERESVQPRVPAHIAHKHWRKQQRKK
jgi:hypothetical protein